MPKQKPGRSKQDYQTSPEFLQALRRKLGILEFDCDLAADDENHVCPRFYTEEDDAFSQTWKLGTGWNFLNPPYGDIEPWVLRAGLMASREDAQTAVLIPASVGSNWWVRAVHGIAHVLFLNGRIQFVGTTGPYPKDCAICLFSPAMIGNGGYGVWTWK